MKTDILGKKCRDMVSGQEGIVMTLIEWQTGCDQYGLQGQGIYGTSYCFREQLIVLDDARIAGVPPDYADMADFGKRCRDRYTAFSGLIVGRMILYLSGEQYAVLPTELHNGQIARYEWLDKSRIVIEEKACVPTEDVSGPKSGGILPSCYQP